MRRCLDLGDLGSGGAFFALLDGELNTITLGQGSETAGQDGAVVHEDIIGAGIGGNETKALLIAEPLHGALNFFTHWETPFLDWIFTTDCRRYKVWSFPNC